MALEVAMRETTLENVGVRALLTLVLAALLWAAWMPAAHWVHSARYRALAVLFISVAFIWKVWPNLAHEFGNFQARLLLTIIYGVFVFPFGMIVRLCADPLRIKKSPTHWLNRPDEGGDMSWAKRQ
jgi:hypothetical protein